MKINKLSIIFFLIIFAFFSCTTEEINNKSIIEPLFELKIDSINAEKFAKSFIEAVNNSDAKTARSNIQIHYRSDSFCVADLLAVNELFSEVDLFTQLNQQVMLGTDLKYQKYYNHEQGHKVVFRLFTAPQEVNYYEINLENLNNKIVITDYKSFRTWTTCSEIIDELANLICVNNKMEIQKFTNGFRYLDSARIAFDRLDPELAEMYFTKIESALRQTEIMKAAKFNLELHSTIAIREKTLIDKLKNTEKGSANHWLNLFYLEAEQKNYTAARLSLMNLKEYVGEDAILNYLEGITYFEEYKYDKAIEMFVAALTINPKIPDIHLAKVICLIEMNSYVQAVESLLVMEDYFEVNNVNWDKEFMAYPEFLISEEYSQWLERVAAIEGDEI